MILSHQESLFGDPTEILPYERNHFEEIASNPQGHSYYGPSLYYVSTFLNFFRPTHPLCQHKYSTERQQKLPFAEPRE